MNILTPQRIKQLNRLPVNHPKRVFLTSKNIGVYNSKYGLVHFIDSIGFRLLIPQ